MGVIRQNLWWASLYNGVAIPAAALGWLNPWLSGVGMALSSAVVVANACDSERSVMEALYLLIR
jgi:Cu2+-exporting ATPase